jgi:hypothetical protein
MRGAMAGPDRAQPKVPPCHRVAVSSCHPAGPQVLSGPAVAYSWPVSLEQRPNDEPHEHGRDTDSTDRRGRLRARASAVSAVASACHDGATGRNFSGGWNGEAGAPRPSSPPPKHLAVLSTRAHRAFSARGAVRGSRRSSASRPCSCCLSFSSSAREAGLERGTGGPDRIAPRGMTVRAAPCGMTPMASPGPGSPFSLRSHPHPAPCERSLDSSAQSPSDWSPAPGQRPSPRRLRHRCGPSPA